jgi:hypothetical protein
MSPRVAAKVKALAASGFRGTNAQWAARLDERPQSTWQALQRLVMLGELDSLTLAPRVVLYAAKGALAELKMGAP